MSQENFIPRRNRLDLNTPAELAIHNAIQEIEKIGAHESLTRAQIYLTKAKNLVGDYIDEMDTNQKRKDAEKVIFGL